MDRDEAIEIAARAIASLDWGADLWDRHAQEIRQVARNRATAALTAAEPFFAEQWRPIEEAPRDGRSFMAWIASSDMGAHWFAPLSITPDGNWWDDSTGDCIQPIAGATHFMPLPAPPVTKSE